MQRRLATLGAELAVLHEAPPTTASSVAAEPDLASTGVPPAAEWPTGVEPGPVMVQPPGRHADRRVGLPPVWPGLGPAQLTVIALTVTVALALTAWWLVRSGAESLPEASTLSPSPVTALVTPVEPQPSAESVSATSGGPGADGKESVMLVVDVAGRVRHPGIAMLEPGSRVIDAIEAAGGARRGVDLSTLNLARLLVDGEQVLVGVRGGPGPTDVSGTGSPAPPGAPGALVNINTADQTELEALPEVGPVTALAIISWREAHGGFTAVAQLLEVDGIGEATLTSVTPFVTV